MKHLHHLINPEFDYAIYSQDMSALERDEYNERLREDGSDSRWISDAALAGKLCGA